MPCMLVIGEKEAAAHSVSVRHAKRGDLGVSPHGTSGFTEIPEQKCPPSFSEGPCIGSGTAQGGPRCHKLVFLVPWRWPPCWPGLCPG
ncbi:MAG: hypothetical protein V4726_09330 [Verrucomicrobiota bacterium]